MHDIVFVKTGIVAKGISQDDILENWVGRWANKSFRMRTMTVLESSPTNSLRRVVPYFYRHVRKCIFKNKKFCFENDYFTHAWLRQV